METKIDILLKIKKLSKSFDEKNILRNIDLTLYKNKIHTILGPSGSGKTTLLNIISGILKFESGSVFFCGDNAISYLFQEDRLLKWLDVYKNIELVLKEVLPRHTVKQKINEYLDKLGLAEYKHYYPSKLSGGMRQRVSAIRAFLYPSNLLLMDEAFKSLDVKIKLKLMRTVIDLWNTNPKTILFVTHDVREALAISHYIHIFSDLPAEIVKEYAITESVNKRDINSNEYLNLESDIYKILLGNQ